MKDLVYEKVWNSRASGNLEVETTGKKIVNNQKDTNAYKLLQLEQWETPKPIRLRLDVDIGGLGIELVPIPN